MKTRLALIVILLLLFSACTPVKVEVDVTPAPTLSPTEVPSPTPSVLDRDLVVLYTNDVHCAVDSGIGYAGLAALKNELICEGNYVVLADAGDAVFGDAIGTISKGELPLEIMNAVGYDVAVPGNHEFDFGIDQFKTLVGKATFPYISANFTDLTTGKLVLDPYKIMEFNGVKVAFVGAMTPKTITSAAPVYFQDANGNFIYGFSQDKTGDAFYSAIQSAVDSARGEGAQYVILLGHLGIEADCIPYTSSELIAATEGIDVVIDGHSHSVVECQRVRNKSGGWTLLTQTGTKFASVGMLLIQKNGGISTGLISDYGKKDDSILAQVAGIQDSFKEQLEKVVATTSVELTINEPGTDTRIIRNAETNLGDLCADAFRSVAGADIAFVNGGGIRANISVGDITYQDLLAVQPHNNVLCVVEASGQEILDSLELGCYATPEESGGFLHVSGLAYEIDTSIPSSVEFDADGIFSGVKGEYRVKNVRVGDSDLDLKKTYTLASHNYQLKESNGCSIFFDNVFPDVPQMYDNQVLIAYITETLGGTIGEEYADPYGQGRITAVN